MLAIENLAVYYGPAIALDGVSLKVEEGQIVALIGRNGAGKSSLLKILAGLEKPDDGLLQVQQGLRRWYVPQEPLFKPGASVFDVVSEAVGEAKALRERFETAHGLDADEMDRLHSQIDHLGGWDWERRVETTLSHLHLEASAIIDTLSGGTRKRVALAQALVTAPDVATRVVAGGYGVVYDLINIGPARYFSN